MITKIIVSVSNDLVSDQRVHKTCMSFLNQGWEVKLIGRKLPKSLSLSVRNYDCKRMKLWFKKGPLFYAEYNIRLFFVLLFSKASALHSNDLDTLPANFLVSKLRFLPLVYDSHEYFTEVPELVNRPATQKIWKGIEAFIFPKLKHVFTVNDSIAKLFSEQYKKPVHVLKNVPRLHYDFVEDEQNNSNETKIVLLQGAGINVDRGAEELVQAMQFVEGAQLHIVGAGDVIPQLKTMTKSLNLQEKVTFFDKMPFEKLRAYTQQAYIGVSLDKATNINYQYSLPNKLFDYIHAGVPVLVSNLIEPAKIVNQYKVGLIVKLHEPKSIAQSINEMVQNKELHATFKQNCIAAKQELNWENEEKKLLSCYNSIFDK